MKPPTMFVQPIGDKEDLRIECPQVYINEGIPQIACCTIEKGNFEDEPSQRFWDVKCAAIDLFPEKSQSSQRDDRFMEGLILFS